MSEKSGRGSRSVRPRRLGSTELTVSELGFGCWQLGGRGWGTYSLGDVVEAIREALDVGVNLFDTAPVYGFGTSEELLGKALRGRSDEAIIVSKGGLVWDDRGRVQHDASAASLRAQLVDSLQRLQRERLDLYLLHWPDERVPFADSVAALRALRDEGLVAHCGVSNASLAQIAALPDDLRSTVEVISLPLNVLGSYAEEFDNVARDGARLLDLAARESLGVLVFDVLARGFITRDADDTATIGRRDLRRRDRRFDPSERNPEIDERRERVRALAAKQGVPPAAVAIRAVLERDAISTALVGMKTHAQLCDNLRYADVDVTELAGLAER